MKVKYIEIPLERLLDTEVKRLVPNAELYNDRPMYEVFKGKDNWLVVKVFEKIY